MSSATSWAARGPTSGRTSSPRSSIRLVARFRPRTRAYWELWIDGDRAVTAEPDPAAEPEPVYGDVYLPRKFKIAVAWPGDNCVDVLANDVGIVPTLSAGTSGELTGFMVYVGGGLGMSHAREDDTYPRLASPLGWVPPHRVVDVVEAIVTTQRDHGNREDRHRARLKYLVDERGIEWMREEVGRPRRWTARPAGRPAAVDRARPPRRARRCPRAARCRPARSPTATEWRCARPCASWPPTAPWPSCGSRRARTCCSSASRRRASAEVEERLRSHGVKLAGDVSNLRRLAIACPALPTCGQALGEAERVLPELVTELEKVLADTGNGDAAVRLNMTGCPNGCARPYTAEIGIVGRTKTTYDVYVGGSPAGDRLAERIRADVPLDQLPAVLAPVLQRYAGADTSFGDWAAAAGTERSRPGSRTRRSPPRRCPSRRGGRDMTRRHSPIWAGIVSPAIWAGIVPPVAIPAQIVERCVA